MTLFRRSRSCVFPLVGALLLTTIFGCARKPQPSPLCGAYRFADGRLITIGGSEGDTLRFRDLQSGRSQRLYPSAASDYHSGSGWASESPINLKVHVDRDRSGIRLSWTEKSDAPQSAVKLPLPEETVTFRSGNVDLFGKLVLPEGGGPFPAVVLVHGSEKDAATLFYDEPYRYAAHGIATLVFDKRGTGRSGGDYGQDFDQLAGDVLAAVSWIRKQPRIDPQRIGLAGYSQGGWVAPLAASRSQGAVKFVLVEFGLAEPPAQEERWEVRNLLRDKGFSQEDQRSADAVVDAIQEIMRRHLRTGWERLDALTETFADAPWLAAVKKRGGLTGSFLKYPHWLLRAYMRRNPRMTSSWFYDPLPVLAHLDAPMLWMIAGEDLEAPNEITIERMQTLRREGRPVDVVIFPNADHGIRQFEVKNGQRVSTGYAPGYFQTESDWLRRQAGTYPQ
jgi:dienelactone hydrolase